MDKPHGTGAMWESFKRIMIDFERARSSFWGQVNAVGVAPWAGRRATEELRVIRAAEAHRSPAVRMITPSLKIARARMQKSRNAMVDQMMPFIRSRAGKLAARLREPELREDLVNEGVLGVLDAMSHVSMTMEGGAFSALGYLKKWIFTRMTRYAERERGYTSRTIPLAGPDEAQSVCQIMIQQDEGASACERQELAERLGAFRASCHSDPLRDRVFELLCKGYSEPEISSRTPQLPLSEIRKIGVDVRNLALVRLQ
jgi:hypothetical protein